MKSEKPAQLVVLSANSATALDGATLDLISYLKEHPETDLADIAYTLHGRKALDYRRIAVCHDTADAVRALSTLDHRQVFTGLQEPRERPVVMVFPGQGSQYAGMGAELYSQAAVFRAEVDRCAEILKPHLGFDLRDVLLAHEDEASERLKQTTVNEPALFVIEYALAQQWISWGVTPAAMIGHSIGEYVAACLSGVVELEDALALVATRARLMQSLPPGAMLAISMPEDKVQAQVEGRDLSVAAVNAPSVCVVSGPVTAVDELEKELERGNLVSRRLHASHAFNSAMTDSILEELVAKVASINLRAPRIPYLSNLPGNWITAEEATDPQYWGRHLRECVRFNAGIVELFKDRERMFLEVGPGRTLSTLLRHHPSKGPARIVLSSLRHPGESEPDLEHMLTTLGRLWLSGVDVKWSQLYESDHRHVDLPTYPEGELPTRRTHTPAHQVESETGHPLLDRQLSETADQAVYATRVNPITHWVLDDHRIVGAAIMPGTAYLEMGRAAFERRESPPDETSAVEISQAFFLAPLGMRDDETREVRTILEKDDDGYQFRIIGELPAANGSEPVWQDYSIGWIRFTHAEPPRRHDLEALRARCSKQEIVITDEYEMDPDLGPRWQSLRRVYLGENELLAKLEIPDEFAADFAPYKLHPALLDRATGTAKHYLGSGGHYLPMSYKRLCVKQPLPRKIFAHIKFRDDLPHEETITFDIILMDESGTESLVIDGFSQKRVNDTAESFRALATMNPATAKKRVAETVATEADLSLTALDKSEMKKLMAMIGEDENEQMLASHVPSSNGNSIHAKQIDFSLFFFAADNLRPGEDKYQLYLEGAKWADRNGLTAVWTPERHFHESGGLYPNPSVLNAALATITHQIKLRAGSIVMPLHHSIRVAEEWAMVDNLSHGRVGLSFTSGWIPNDFAFFPERYPQKRDEMWRGITEVQRLWSGESITARDGKGSPIELKVLPRPLQPQLPIWITCSGDPEMFVNAGERGFNVLTALLTQSVDEVATKIAMYRRSLAEHGFDPASRQVTLMLHTFVGEDLDWVLSKARTPLCNYLKAHVGLIETMTKSLNINVGIDKEYLDDLVAFAFERYYQTASLIGTPEKCLNLMDRLKQIGVDEVACFIDFGIDTSSVLESLQHLLRLRDLFNQTNENSNGRLVHEPVLVTGSRVHKAAATGE